MCAFGLQPRNKRSRVQALVRQSYFHNFRCLTALCMACVFLRSCFSTIRAVPTGVSRSVKKLLKAKVPNLSKYSDVSEFFTRYLGIYHVRKHSNLHVYFDVDREIRGDVSESEAEMDGEHNEVVLPQNLSSRGNVASQKSAIRYDCTSATTSLTELMIDVIPLLIYSCQTF